MKESVNRRRRAADKQARRDSGRRTFVRLRLILVSENMIKQMRAETRLGDMPARRQSVAKKRMQPAVGLAAPRKIVDDFRMAEPPPPPLLLIRPSIRSNSKAQNDCAEDCRKNARRFARLPH